MDCHILLEDRTGYNHENYKYNGNVLLDHLHGATMEHRGPDLDMNAEMEAVADKFRAEGRNVYTIPGGGSNATGALGYVNCAFEMLHQFVTMGLDVDHIVHATGSAGHAGGADHRAQGDEREHPAAGHRRARAQAQAGGERL